MYKEYQLTKKLLESILIMNPMTKILSVQMRNWNCNIINITYSLFLAANTQCKSPNTLQYWNPIILDIWAADLE